MTQTSVLLRPDPEDHLIRERGFTLLEMAVALAVLALATALVAPSLSRMADSWRQDSDLKTLQLRISGLPLQARKLGRPIKLSRVPMPTAPAGTAASNGATDAADITTGELLQLPEGWSLVLREPLLIQANGACKAAAGELKTATAVLPLQISEPFCEVKLGAAP